LVDLLLDAPGRGGHELAGRRVEEQDGRRVGVEDVPNPVEQLDQQVVDREAGEARIGDRLDVAQSVRGSLPRLGCVGRHGAGNVPRRGGKSPRAGPDGHPVGCWGSAVLELPAE
jgi:hypothetical protein